MKFVIANWKMNGDFELVNQMMNENLMMSRRRRWQEEGFLTVMMYFINEVLAEQL